MRRSALILLLLLLAAATAVATFCFLRHDRGEARAASGPSAEMMGAMDRMHEAMGRTPMTGDVDRDFVALMIPHHQSAVDMARVYLRHGRDPELRRLAANIVESQEAEIRQMGARRPAPAAGGSEPHSGH